jgi:hypothetical protein
MTPRERKDFPWIVIGFGIVVGIIIAAALMSAR